jgi:hypothetical protein
VRDLAQAQDARKVAMPTRPGDEPLDVPAFLTEARP